MTQSSESVAMTACVRCGVAIDPTQAIYDKSGGLLCSSCATMNQIAEGDSRAASSLVSAAIFVLLAGILSWTCLNVFYVLSIGAIAGGVGWFTTLKRSPEYKARMGSKYGPCIIAVAFGMLVGTFPPLMLLLRIAGVIVGR